MALCARRSSRRASTYPRSARSTAPDARRPGKREEQRRQQRQQANQRRARAAPAFRQACPCTANGPRRRSPAPPLAPGARCAAPQPTPPGHRRERRRSARRVRRPRPGQAPAFGAGSMPDVSAWTGSDGERLMFIYGENDPYSAAAFDPTGAADAHRFFEPGGNHAASILGLLDADRQEALGILSAWTGVAPQALQPRASGKPDPARVAWLRGGMAH
ncbi:MAG: hypothetical protein WKG00_40750 [Polyangiaceae bacterium]